MHILIHKYPVTPETARGGIEIHVIPLWMKSGSRWGFGTCEVTFLWFFQRNSTVLSFSKCFVLAKCLFSSILVLKNIGCNRIPRPVFPRLPVDFGTLSAERFADSCSCNFQKVFGHIDATSLPRACVHQKPWTAGFQSVWCVFLHVLPALIYHASIDVQLWLSSFDPFSKLSFGMVHIIMIDSTTTCYLWIGRGPICD